MLSGRLLEDLKTTLIDDLRAAIWSLKQRPEFTTVALLILAVALGANTAVFSVLRQSVLRPLPYPGAEGVVILVRESPVGGFLVAPRFEQLLTWRERAESFTAIEGFDGTRVTLLGRGEPRSVDAAWVTPGLFSFLGVSPALGPGLKTGTAGERRVVLSDALWRELFGADPGAIGHKLQLGEELYTVSGVMGRGFRFVPQVDAELWLPIPKGAAEPQSVVTLARLAPDVSPEAAAMELLALERHLASQKLGEDPNAVWPPRIHGPDFLIGEDLGRAVWLLQAAVALILLIACANVGNLFLIRTKSRSREIAMRTALGAGRGRLIRALLLESLLLAGAASILGLVLALWGGSLVASLQEHWGPGLGAPRLEPGLFAFTAVAGAFAACAFGLIPALTASRADLRTALQAGSASTTCGWGAGSRVHAALVVAEVALALVLLSGADLLTRSFVKLVTTDTGFEAEGLLTILVELPNTRYREPERQKIFVRELRTALEGSGIEGATLASSAPPEGALFFANSLQVEGRSDLPVGLVDKVSLVWADPDYFRTLGIDFIKGGPFSQQDLFAGEREERGVVIDEHLSRVLWPAGDAIGSRLKLGISAEEPWSRVVGIVSAVAQLGVGSPHNSFQMYFPLWQTGRVAVMVRQGRTVEADTLSPGVVSQRIAALVHSIDPTLPVPPAERMEVRLAESLGRQRFQMALMLIFAGIALVLTVVGVYSVLSYAVRRRFLEIGVRAALGARPGQIIGLIIGYAALLVGIGLAAGLAASLALGRILNSQLTGVVADQSRVVASAAALVAIATTLATLFPALRAARLDPAKALHEE